MKTYKQRKYLHTCGFTLLEVVVAVSIFTILAAVSYAAINGVVEGKKTIETKRESIISMQRVYGLLKNDIRYAVARGVRDELGGREQALLVEQNGEVLRITVQYPHVTSGVSIKRVSWELRDDILVRKGFASLDRVEGLENADREVLSGVSEINIYTHSVDTDQDGNNAGVKVVNRNRGWEDDRKGLPLAIEIELLMLDEQRYRWLFDMASSS